MITGLLLLSLPEPVRSKLALLAEGRDEGINDTIDTICRFFIDNESEYAEAPLIDGLTHYTENYILGG